VSRKKLLSQARSDSEKIEILNDLCFNYANTNLEKSFNYGEEALQLAGK
jgi:hypothetical protein